MVFGCFVLFGQEKSLFLLVDPSFDARDQSPRSTSRVGDS